jgi:GTP cyclohydrolase II
MVNLFFVIVFFILILILISSIFYKCLFFDKNKIEDYVKTSCKVSDYDELVYIYCFRINGKDQWAIVYGNPEKDQYPLVRVQSQCVTGMEFNDTECDCKQNLTYSKKMIQENKNGGILFLLNQDGRNLGGCEKLTEKHMRMDKLMNMTTILKLRNHVFDLRDYNYLPECLKLMGFSNSIRLITRFPTKANDIIKSGINVVEIIHYPYTITSDNYKYLQMKKCEFNFDFPDIKCDFFNSNPNNMKLGLGRVVTS